MPLTSHDRFTAWRTLFKGFSRSQEDAVAKLRQAGIADRHLVIVLQYFKSLERRTLTDVEAIFTTYDTLRRTHPGKLALYDHWLESQLAKVRVVYNDAMTELIVAAMRYVTNTVKPPVPSSSVYPDWPDFLVMPAKVLLWLLGLLSCLLIVMALSGESFFWIMLSIFGSLVAWSKVGLSTKGLLYPASLVGIVVILVLFSLGQH
jgi:hypothetical protein